MKTFVVVMDTLNVHLTKDVGLIPFGMHKYYGYDSFFASYDNSPYPNLAVVPGLNLWEVDKATGNYNIDVLGFILKNAKKIDVLNVYHIRLVEVIRIWLYLLCNPKGKVYWKADGGESSLHKSAAFRFLYRITMKKCDVISTEIEENASRYTQAWGVPFSYIGNPYHPDELTSFRPFEKRDNIILTVGRLGTEQKATEILLDGFRKAHPKTQNWKLKLVGPIEKEETNFEKYLEDWFNKYPEMRNHIEFVGEIADRTKMTETYQGAKVFCLPSRHEGFPLVLTEAGISGCFIIGTTIPSIKAFTKNFAYAAGIPVDNTDRLASCLIEWCNEPEKMEKKARELYEYVTKENSLKTVCEKIQKGLENVGER